MNMKKVTLILTMAIVSTILVGCRNADPLGLATNLSVGQGTTRGLGDVSYQQAFATARGVLSQYYSIDPAKTSANSGIIACRPKRVDASKDRLLGNSPARQIAKMEISRDNGQVVAQLLVMQQRQGAAARERMGYAAERRSSNYRGDPGNETPADLDAATTTEQNETWTNEKPLHDVEAQILDDLVKTLGGR